MSDDKINIWMQMLEGQNNHGRHHESLRSQSANIILAVSAALLAFLASTTAWQDKAWALIPFLILINVYGFIMSIKHHERSRLHYSVARSYANVISEATRVGGKSLNQVRAVAHENHKQRFSLVRKLPANVLWSGLHLLIAGMGVCFLFN